MNIDVNKALVKRYLKMWNTGDVTIADEVLSPTWMDHAHPEVIGTKSVKQAVLKVREVYPEFRITIESILSEGDLVAVRGIVERESTSRVMWFVRIEDGKMKEMWTGSEM
ncbi:hypothetical protein BK138_02280 [Paenibacillus rhizosphaerae]|uniref:SnoaL-like domain-containing protein n=1 Tax=Paenibacillus rhizosphaerae TaxID=297318 RepID=A0A1R1F0B8_9BACL|nr:nuclear transport factor 2 family protein [Paenibacillus rhizosphaerae]OMF57456.1 hypothetical protein BK138_02280 [Paenibacillus rhizosphaerae]